VETEKEFQLGLEIRLEFLGVLEEGRELDYFRKDEGLARNLRLKSKTVGDDYEKLWSVWQVLAVVYFFDMRWSEQGYYHSDSSNMRLY